VHATAHAWEDNLRYWLMKTEPSDFSIDHLKRRKREPWTGVRNYQARNFMRDGMRDGDEVFIYHSNCEEPGIAGIARVAGQAYPDPTQFKRTSKYFDPKSTPDAPRWWMIDVEYVRKLERVIPLSELKEQPELEGMPLLARGSRLSVQPVASAFWRFILGLEKKSQ